MLTLNNKYWNKWTVSDQNQFGNIVLLQICIEGRKTLYFHLCAPQLFLPVDLYDFLPQLCYYYVAFNDPCRENQSLRLAHLKYQQCCGGTESSFQPVPWSRALTGGYWYISHCQLKVNTALLLLIHHIHYFAVWIPFFNQSVRHKTSS